MSRIESTISKWYDNSMRNRVCLSDRQGFSLIEMLIYISIFVAISAFLVSILIIFTQVHVRQTSINEVNDQISFVNNTVERLVRESRIIDMTSNVTTSTLTLRMASSTLDPTTIYLSDNTVYLREGSYDPIPLTDSQIQVNDFSVTKYENPGGYAIVQVHITISYNTEGQRAKYKRTTRTAISRVTAATFDSSLLPNTGSTYDVGESGTAWRYGYFSSGVGIGAAPVAGTSIKTTDDIYISTSTAGIIFTQPDGTCVRFFLDNARNSSTTDIGCPGE